MAGRKGHSIHRDWRFSAGWQLYFQVKVRQRRKISCGICSKKDQSPIWYINILRKKYLQRWGLFIKRAQFMISCFFIYQIPNREPFSFHSNFRTNFWNHHKLNKLLNKKSAIEPDFVKSFDQKAKNCTVWREEKGIRGRPKGREKRVEKDKIA